MLKSILLLALVVISVADDRADAAVNRARARRQDCIDTDINDVADVHGNSCLNGQAPYNSNVQFCGFFDNEGFTAGDMCCGCGGGTDNTGEMMGVFQFSSLVQANINALQSSIVSTGVAQAAELEAARVSHDATLGTLRDQLTALSAGSDSPLAMGAKAVAAEMQARTQSLLAGMTTNGARLTGMEASIDEQQSTAVVQGAALQVAVSTSVAELGASVDSQINAVMSNMTVAGVSLRRAQSVGAAALTASVTVQIRRVNVSIRAVTSALALKRDERLHMWSGSCSNHGDGGWREYCFDRQDINTGLPYFRKESNSRMQARRPGYFTVNFFRLLQSCNWEYTLIYFHDTHRRHSHSWTGGTSSWRDQEVKLTYPLAVNQRFWARAWTCWWSVWNTDRSQTRFTAMYAGALAS